MNSPGSARPRSGLAIQLPGGTLPRTPQPDKHGGWSHLLLAFPFLRVVPRSGVRLPLDILVGGKPLPCASRVCTAILGTAGVESFPRVSPLYPGPQDRKHLLVFSCGSLIAGPRLRTGGWRGVIVLPAALMCWRATPSGPARVLSAQQGLGREGRRLIQRPVSFRVRALQLSGGAGRGT